MYHCSIHGESGFCEKCFDIEVKKAMSEMREVDIETFVRLTTPKGWLRNEKDKEHAKSS